MDFKSTEEVERFIDWLFDDLQSILPAFKQAWPSQPDYEKSKRSWALAFTESNLKSFDQIKIGLRMLRSSTNPFVPTAGQFIGMCKPTPNKLGIPSIEQSYNEACKNSHPSVDKKWTHKAVYHAWKQTGSHLLSTYPRKNSFPVFERNYQATVQMILDGKELTEIPIAIKDGTNEKKITKSVGHDALIGLKAMLSCKKI